MGKKEKSGDRKEQQFFLFHFLPNARENNFYKQV